MRALVFVLALVALALSPSEASAQAVPSKCNAAKLKAGGAYAQAIVGCQSKAVAKGANIDDACLAKALAKLEKAFERAANKDDCNGSAASFAARDQADSFRLDLAEQVLPPRTCCEFAVIATLTCSWADDDADCTARGGTPGAAGSDCNSDGACTTAGLSSGPCCEAQGVCAGGEITSVECAGDGGTFMESGNCLASGECLPH